MNDTYNADDEEQVEAAKTKAQKREFERNETIRDLMSKKEGRAWINELIEFCDILGNPIVLGDSHATYSNIGMANAGKMIFAQVEAAAPESFLLMRREATQNEKS